MILKTGTHIIDPRPKINILSEYLFPSSLTGLSLILPLNETKPSLKNYKKSVYWFRIHIGLESADDLIKDLERGFKNYEKK